MPREPGDPEDKAKRVQFEPGQSSAIIKGQSSSGDEYLVRARASQTIHVKLTSPSDDVKVWVESDVGEEINYPGWDTEWTGKLPITGDYRITVATGPITNTYTLEITIR